MSRRHKIAEVPQVKKIDTDTYRGTICWLWGHGQEFEAMQLMWRDKFVDCPPTRQLVKALATHRKLLVMGHGSASKTFTATAFKLLKWWMNPMNSSFVLTSATIKSLSHRAWADLKLLVRDSAIPMPGFITGSQYKMRYAKEDDKHLVMAVSGEDENSVTKIQGLHTEELDLVIDEADNVYNTAIWKSMSNLGTSGDFKVVGLANPMDRNSVFGLNCEPVLGWDSIDINSSFEWESKSGYHVIRLDGLRSPNIVEGETKYSFLLTQKGIDDIVDEFGENSPNYYTYVRAWFPSLSDVNTLFTGSLTAQMERQDIRFYADTTPVAACDPSLGGGNRCVVVIGRAGLLGEDHRKGCVIADKFIYVKHRDPETPVTHDFAEQIREICVAHNVEPENFAIGASTADLGICDYLSEHWSKKIVKVDPNGMASTRKILQEDSKTAEQRFDRKITEMMWTVREWAKAGQLAVRDMPRDLRIQCEARRWEMERKGARRISIETKDLMKKRGLKSPDELDSLANLVILVRDKFGDLEPTNLPFDPELRSRNVWAAKRRETRNVFEPDYKNDGVLGVSSERVDSMGYENDGMSGIYDGMGDGVD